MPSSKDAPEPELVPFCEETLHVSRQSLLDDFLTQEQLANELNVTQRTLQRWAELRIGPPLIAIGRTTRIYKKSSVLAWLSARERKPRSSR
ncbi:MAG: helix-turn-helix domain-containing protein [Candidatus Sulfotelmatobacter sp.]|jgi:hypothetical protein